MIFATILPEAGGPEAIGWIMVTLAAIALTMERVMALVRSFRRSPAVEETFISKHECGLHHNAMGGRVIQLEARMNRVERKMESDKVEIIAAVEQRVNAINSRVDTLSKTLSAVDERSTAATARLAQLDQKMDRLLERFSLSTKTNPTP